MRSTSLVLAAVIGLAVSAFAAPAGALTPASSSGLSLAAQSVDPVASVHCRSYKHRSYNHGWGYGCRGGAHVSIYERTHRHGYEEREGGRARVGVHERSSTRSETDVRSRERTTTRRSHEGSSARGDVKGGTGGSSTTGKSGTTGKSSTTGTSNTNSGGGGGGGNTEQKSGTQH